MNEHQQVCPKDAVQTKEEEMTCEFSPSGVLPLLVTNGSQIK